MHFGIFDHMDIGDVAQHEHFATRLMLAELAERVGIYAYHVAEHHCTPLGFAPSPSVFLAAMSQRTTRLRFGPLVYALPYYHPLRLIQEICMLDQMSGGRLEIGFGRGASPIEASYFGVEQKDMQGLYVANAETILEGLTSEVMESPDGFGMPMVLRPLQQPHPPMWYGVHSPESAERAARQGHNIVSNGAAEKVRPAIERFKAVWAEAQGARPLPKVGLVRFVVVGETDEEAQAAAARAYPVWFRSFNYLYHRQGRSPMLGERAASFEALAAEGKGVAGTPDTVARFLRREMAETGANYCVGQFFFGDLSTAEMTRSIELFGRHVIPMLQERPAAAVA